MPIVSGVAKQITWTKWHQNDSKVEDVESKWCRLSTGMLRLKLPHPVMEFWGALGREHRNLPYKVPEQPRLISYLVSNKLTNSLLPCVVSQESQSSRGAEGLVD